MISKTDIEKLTRFCELNADEKKEQYTYSLTSNFENNFYFQQHIKAEFDENIKNHVDDSQNLTYILDRIHFIISRDNRKKGNTVLRNLHRRYFTISAMLLVPLLIARDIWFSIQIDEESSSVVKVQVTNTLFFPLESRIKYSLPDGAEGWHNSISSFIYIPFTNNRYRNLFIKKPSSGYFSKQ